MHGAHIFDCCCTWLICAKQHFLVARCGRTTDTDWRHALHSHTAQSRYCCIWLCANAICQREWKFTQYRVQCCRITRFVRRWTGILCPKIPNRNFYNKIMASSFMSFSGWFSPGAHLHCCWVSPLRMEAQTTMTTKERTTCMACLLANEDFSVCSAIFACKTKNNRQLCLWNATWQWVDKYLAAIRSCVWAFVCSISLLLNFPTEI